MSDLTRSSWGLVDHLQARHAKFRRRAAAACILCLLAGGAIGVAIADEILPRGSDVGVGYVGR